MASWWSPPAGNAGTSGDAVGYAPGNDPFVITAGSTDDRGTWSNSDDVLAPWSSRGLTQNGVRKPEVLAPGVRLVAALAPTSDFSSLCPTCVVDGRYFRVSGTSVSAAVVSGVAALDARGASGMDAEPSEGGPWSRRSRTCRARVPRSTRPPRSTAAGQRTPARAQHARVAGDRPHRLVAGQLPPGELPRRGGIVPGRLVEPRQLPLRLLPAGERRGRPEPQQLPGGGLPTDHPVRGVAT
jgi:hypothetical protein